MGGPGQPGGCTADSNRLADRLKRSRVETAELRSGAVDEPDRPRCDRDPDREAADPHPGDLMGHWIDAKDLACIGRGRPHVSVAHCEPERSSPRQWKRSCLRRQRAGIEAEERGGRDLQDPQFRPVIRERSNQGRKLCPCEYTAALPVERDDEAGAGAAAADVLDGGEELVAGMRQVGSLPADEDLPLDRAGGEIETQERSIGHWQLRPRLRQPERIATHGYPPRVTRNTQRRRHPACRHLLARAVRDKPHRAADRGDHGRDDDREPEPAVR